MAKIYVNVEIVKRLMAERNMDIHNLAEKAGISTATLRKYLIGKQNHIPVLAAFKIVGALGVSVATIINELE